MSFSIRFFGTSAASPSPRRGFACIGLVKDGGTAGEDITILDCGDGSIHRIIERNTNVLSISSILITHLHSDHLSGLTQIVETMGIEKRTRDLDVYGPRGLKDYFSMIQSVTNVAAGRRFEIKIHELAPSTSIPVSEYEISCFAMNHTVPCIGYRIEHRRSFSLAYTGDTEPCNNSVPLAHGVDLLIHEATFLAKDLQKARESKHSTPKEAAEIAMSSNAKSLILTHVSDRHETEEDMLKESQAFFSKTRVAYDGLEVPL